MSEIHTRKLRVTGASLSVTIPKAIREELSLEEGRDVTVRGEAGHIIVAPVRGKMSPKDRVAMYEAKGLKPGPLLHEQDTL